MPEMSQQNSTTRSRHVLCNVWPRFQNSHVATSSGVQRLESPTLTFTVCGMTFATCLTDRWCVRLEPMVLQALRDILPRWILWLCLAEIAGLCLFATSCHHHAPQSEDLIMRINLTQPSLSNAPVQR